MLLDRSFKHGIYSTFQQSAIVGAAPRRDYVQDERYIAKEHMDVRCDCVGLAQCLKKRGKVLLHNPGPNHSAISPSQTTYK